MKYQKALGDPATKSGNKGTLALWVNEYKAKNNLLPVNDLKNETLEQENKRLKKELAILKQEKEIFLCLHSL